MSPARAEHDPETVTTALVTAVWHVQGRLGGTQVDAHGAPFDEERARAFVAGTVAALEAEGFVPGSSPALQLF